MPNKILDTLQQAANKLPPAPGGDKRTLEEKKKDDAEKEKAAFLYRLVFGGPKK